MISSTRYLVISVLCQKRTNSSCDKINLRSESHIFRGDGRKFPGGGRQNSSGGWVTGNIFQDIFLVGISLFLNTFREVISSKKSN